MNSLPYMCIFTIREIGSKGMRIRSDPYSVCIVLVPSHDRREGVRRTKKGNRSTRRVTISNKKAWRLGAEQIRPTFDLSIIIQNTSRYRQRKTINSKMLLPSALLLGLTALTHAAHLTVSVAPSPQLPNPATLTSTTHAVLLGPAGTSYDVPIRRNSIFVFPDLAAASYLLTVHSRDYFFPPLRIDVTASSSENSGQDNISAWQTFRGNEWSNKGPSYGSGQGELNVQVTTSGMKDYYQPRGGFSIMSFLKSPMILMGLVSVVFIFGMPYIMENSKHILFFQERRYRCEALMEHSQWTPKPKPNSKRCRRRAPSVAAMAVQRVSCRISTWPAGWLAKGRVAAGVEAVRRSRCPSYRLLQHHATSTSYTPAQNYGKLAVSLHRGTMASHIFLISFSLNGQVARGRDP